MTHIESLRDLRLLVVGCGSIGARHLTNLKELGAQNVAACDPDPERRSIASPTCVEVFSNYAQALSTFRPNAVLVCTTPNLHISQCREAILTGADVFVEKPLSLGRDGVEDLMVLAMDSNRIVQVGYNLRFHPGFQMLHEMTSSGRIGDVVSSHSRFGLYLPSWWSNRDYRDTYIVKEAVGGGLLFDLSHEVDIARWLIGEAVEVGARGSNHPGIEMDSPDDLHLLVRFANTAIAHIHIDCWRPSYTRSCNLLGTTGELLWESHDGRTDSATGSIQIRTHEQPEWADLPIVPDQNRAYKDEIGAFLSSLVTREEPLVELQEGIHTLDVLLAAKRSLSSGIFEPVVSTQIMNTSHAVEREILA